MSDSKIRKFKYYLHLPLIAGLALAFGGLPLYDNAGWLCYIKPPPLAENYRKTLIFGILPVSVAVFVTTINMLCVYFKVRR